MLESTFTKTVEVRRLQLAADDTQEYGVHIAELACHIQPLDEGFTPDVEGNFGKDELLMCNVADIKEMDRVWDSEAGYEYTVVSSEKYSFMGEEHMEVRIRRSNASALV